MAKLNVFDWIAMVLVLVGAVNWGLVGLASFSGISYSWDLVAMLLGGIPALASIVYLLVGVSGVYLLFRLGNMRMKK